MIFTQAGFFDEAIELLEESRSHLEPNIYMYCSLLAPLAGKNDAETTETFFKLHGQMKAEVSCCSARPRSVELLSGTVDNGKLR